jgi:hypothetical protein
MVKIKAKSGNLVIMALVYGLSMFLLYLTIVGILSGSSLIVSNNIWNLIFSITILGCYSLFFFANASIKNRKGLDVLDVIDIGTTILYSAMFALSTILGALDLAVDPIGYLLRFIIFVLAVIHSIYMLGRTAAFRIRK